MQDEGGEDLEYLKVSKFSMILQKLHLLLMILKQPLNVLFFVHRWATLSSGLSSWGVLAATTPSTALRFNWFDLSPTMVTLQAIGVFGMEELSEAVHVELWGLEEEEEDDNEEEEEDN